MASRVFLVDDDTFNLKVAKKILQNNGIDAVPIESGARLLEMVRTEIPDLVLLDILMPQMDGFETLSRLRELEKEKNIDEIPVIFLTSDEDNESETHGFEMGIADYIRKPFDPEVLIKRIDNVLSRQKLLNKFYTEATIDRLTGLYNKAATNSKLEMLCQRKPGFLMMIDLDSFKLVNDIYGHDAGDQILVSFADCLKKLLGENDVIGRMGGDEFTAFSVSLKNDKAIEKLSEDLNREFLKDAYRILGENMDIPLGASIGATFINGMGEDYALALKKADKALYNVKNNGKHGAAVFKDNANEEEEKEEINLKTISMIMSERNITSSALKLDKSSFANVYRFVMRYIMRYHRNACKILINLDQGPDAANAEIDELYEKFGDFIGGILRKSDLIVQIRKNVYFVLLTDIRIDAVEQVAGNLARQWREANGDKLLISYETEFLKSEEVRVGGDSKLWVAIVDDDELNLKIAQKILIKNDIDATTFKSGEDLLEFIKENRPDLILLDLNMPGIDGFETMRRLRMEETEIADIPVVFLTSEDDTETEKTALKLGAMDFIRKPFIPEILTLRVKQIAELLKLQKHLAIEVEKKTKENEQMFLNVVSSLAGAIDAKDSYTNGHSSRVADYSKEIARRYGYNMKEQSDIYIMGLLHDVGKIGVPDAVITKPGELTKEEFEQIKRHPVIGSQILRNIKEMPKLSVGARWHHERYDGGGYPDGLVGEEIPEEARIIAVADAYDAMTSHRSYRKVMSQQMVRDELVNGMGTQFDPRFAEIMIKMIDEDKDYRMRELSE
ncbi:MAG: response regulator [Eubacterium sp.]|nr:response regulator [Eubacterium sp.]